MSSRTHQKRQCWWLQFGGGRHGGVEGNDSKPSLVTVWCCDAGASIIQPKRFFKKKQQRPVKFRHSAGKRFFHLKFLSRELLASGCFMPKRNERGNDKLDVR
jgi:hypothetical protein